MAKLLNKDELIKIKDPKQQDKLWNLIENLSTYKHKWRMLEMTIHKTLEQKEEEVKLGKIISEILDYIFNSV